MNSKNLVKLNSSFTEDDFHWMKVAINYARHGIGLTGKNPSVGCVIVKNNQICGIGRTSNSGRPHAEENALLISGSKSKGATLYVTLEPCAHHGLTPPCTQAISAELTPYVGSLKQARRWESTILRFMHFLQKTGNGQ